MFYPMIAAEARRTSLQKGFNQLDPKHAAILQKTAEAIRVAANRGETRVTGIYVEDEAVDFMGEIFSSLGYVVELHPGDEPVLTISW